MKNFYILLFALTLSGFAKINAQNYGSLRGFVTDSSNGEILAYATVYLLDTKQGNATDTRGFYSIPSIPVGMHNVVFSFVGYIPKVLEVKIRTDRITEVNVQLIPGNY